MLGGHNSVEIKPGDARIALLNVRDQPAHYPALVLGATVSMVTAQVVPDPYRTFHSQLVGKLMAILSARNH